VRLEKQVLRRSFLMVCCFVGREVDTGSPDLLIQPMGGLHCPFSSDGLGLVAESRRYRVASFWDRNAVVTVVRCNSFDLF